MLNLINNSLINCTFTKRVGRIFSRAWALALGNFSKFFPRGTKSGEFWFFPLTTKKTTFFVENFKIQGERSPLPPFRRPWQWPTVVPGPQLHWGKWGTCLGKHSGMLPQNIFVTPNQIIFYCVAVLKEVALQLHCVATTIVTTSLDQIRTGC